MQVLASAMILLRRFAVICALALWMGGFTFYSSFAIPAATEQLGSAREAGFITRRVTQSLNVCGVVALSLLVWNVVAGWGQTTRREHQVLGGTVALLALAEIALLTLHPLLDARLDVQMHSIRPRSHFFALHQSYLWISSVQWGVGLLHLLSVLAIWRRQDRMDPTIEMSLE